MAKPTRFRREASLTRLDWWGKLEATVNQEELILERQVAEPLDEQTLAALHEGEVAIREGRVVASEQSRANARERYRAWQKANARKCKTVVG